MINGFRAVCYRNIILLGYLCHYCHPDSLLKNVFTVFHIYLHQPPHSIHSRLHLSAAHTISCVHFTNVTHLLDMKKWWRVVLAGKGYFILFIFFFCMFAVGTLQFPHCGIINNILLYLNTNNFSDGMLKV